MAHLDILASLKPVTGYKFLFFAIAQLPASTKALPSTGLVKKLAVFICRARLSMRALLSVAMMIGLSGHRVIISVKYLSHESSRVW